MPLNQPPLHFQGYAYVDGNDDLMLDRLSEEHGILRSKKGDTGLRIGQVLSLIPSHICPCINLQNELYVIDGGEISKLSVDARGMLW